MQSDAVEEVMVSNTREKKNTERSDTKLPSHLLMQASGRTLPFWHGVLEYCVEVQAVRCVDIHHPTSAIRALRLCHPSLPRRGARTTLASEAHV